MSTLEQIPLAITTIRVLRVPAGMDIDPDDPNPPADIIVAEHVRATFTVPTATAVVVGGAREVFTSTVRCDPCDLRITDTVIDETDGSTWTVLWSREQNALGQHFVMAGLRLAIGVT